MPSFSQASLDKLKTCHEDLQTLFNEVIKHWDCTVIEGHRGEEAQNKAFDSGKSKLKFPNGKHNAMPSNAVDVSPYPVPKWGDARDFAYFGGFVMGVAIALLEKKKITHKIRFGGDWNMNQRLTDEKFSDCLHFELIDK